MITICSLWIFLSSCSGKPVEEKKPLTDGDAKLNTIISEESVHRYRAYLRIHVEGPSQDSVVVPIRAIALEFAKAISTLPESNKDAVRLVNETFDVLDSPRRKVEFCWAIASKHQSPELIDLCVDSIMEYSRSKGEGEIRKLVKRTVADTVVHSFRSKLLWEITDYFVEQKNNSMAAHTCMINMALMPDEEAVHAATFKSRAILEVSGLAFEARMLTNEFADASVRTFWLEMSGVKDLVFNQDSGEESADGLLWEMYEMQGASILDTALENDLASADAVMVGLSILGNLLWKRDLSLADSFLERYAMSIQALNPDRFDPEHIALLTAAHAALLDIIDEELAGGGFEEVIDIDPRSAATLLQIESEVAEGFFNVLLERATSAASSQPQWVMGYFDRMDTFAERAGRQDLKARAMVARVDIAPTEKSADIHLLQAANLFEQSENFMSEAQKLYERIVLDYPQSHSASRAYVSLASLSLVSAEPLKAIENCDLYRSKYPEGEQIPTANFLRALATAELGDVNKAREFMEQVTIDYPQVPESADALLWLLLLAVDESNYTIAYDYAREYGDRFPEGEDIATIRTLLSELERTEIVP